jgi:uncharacterized protein involved in exopolysaccharide biosynthesis
MPAESLDESGERVDPAVLRHRVGFVFGAVRRRKWLALSIFGLVIAATVEWIRIAPRTYHVETKILTKRQQAMPNAVRSNTGDEAPTYLAYETIHRRDNLISIVKQTRLVERWRFDPSRPLSQENKVNLLVKLLDDRLAVSAGDGLLTISIYWPDPQVAYELVEAAWQHFRDARREQEISSIEEVLSVLEARTEAARAEIEELQTESSIQPSKAADSPADARKGVARPSAIDLPAMQIKTKLETTRRMIRDEEDFRRRRLEDLRAQLAQRLATYGESYPSVVSLQQEIQEFSREPPELAELRVREERLDTSYSRRKRDVSEGSQSISAERTGAETRTDRGDGDPRLVRAMLKYQTLLERLETARIDLDTSGSAFKHRYSVMWPAKVPTEPARPNVPRWLAMGSALALFLAVLAATLADVRAGRLVEPWQVEQLLDLPVLAEVERP